MLTLIAYDLFLWWKWLFMTYDWIPVAGVEG